MLSKLPIPAPTLPRKLPGYDLPQTPENLLNWDFVVQQMTAAHYYWLSTVSPAGHPHVRPVWGVWFEDRVHFDGGPQTRWARNLYQNPLISVNLPDGDKVVIIEGRASALDDDALSAEQWTALEDLYGAKYDAEGSPYWVVHPHKVLAWDGEMLGTMTRWLFKEK